MNVNMNMHEASSRMEGRVVALRKGTWSSEEDLHLRICVQTYGEGNWHLVPRRANLNRCRKSCRLRWLNYLRPDIKKGKFATDEVDLMVRLQRLLGNRWSLIAGRLPGRTANDVKNYWNSHMLKKRAPPTQRMVNNIIYPSDQRMFSPGILVKPRPRTFKNTNTGLTCSDLKTTSLLHPGPPSTDNLAGNKPLPSPLSAENNDNLWWEKLLMFGEDEPQYCCYPNTNWSTEEVSSSLHQEASACESNISEAKRY